MLRLLLISLLISTCCLARPAAAQTAPVRSVDTIAWAIGVDHGYIALATRRAYAQALRKSGIRYNFDGLTGVAMIRSESRFRSGAIGDGGRAIGLAQIHYQYLCKGEQACAAKRRSLLNPLVNIATMGRLIHSKRAWCRKHTGKPALFARWLHAYGYNQTRNVRCNQKRTKRGWTDLPVPTGAARIIAYRRKLIRLLHQRRRRRRR